VGKKTVIVCGVFSLQRLNKFTEEVTKVGGKSTHRERMIRSLNDEQLSMAQRIAFFFSAYKVCSYLKW